MKKFLVILIILFLISGGVYWTYNYFQKSSGIHSNALNFIPNDAVFILETDEPIENWKDISASEPWKFLKGHEFFNELSESADALDSLILSNETIFGDFGSRQIILSAHLYKSNDYDFLYVIDLENIAKANQLIVSFLGDIEGYKTTKRTHRGVDIFAMLDLKTKETIYLSFMDNILLCSYVNALVEKSIEQREEPVIARDISFIEINKEVAGEGMFRFYLNYEFFDNYMKIYTGSDNSYIKSLSESFKYAGFRFDYDADETLLKLEGFSNLIPDKETYLQLLQKNGTSKIKFDQYVSKRAAVVTALNLNDFQSFYDELENQMKNNPEEYKEYETNKNKIERFLKIDLKENFISWIGEEIAFVQTQPIGLGEKNEYALFIQAKDGDEAKENLDFIGKQIKKRTPVKFKGLEYNGYEINFLSVKGMFKVLMGDFFGKIEKPYYTIIDDYVIFSNHPQTIKNIIDDYIKKETLVYSEGYKDFKKNLNQDNSLLIYVNTTIAHHSLKEFLDPEAKQDLVKNKPYFEAFPYVAFQISSSGDGFKTKIIADFLNTSELQKEISDVTNNSEEKAKMADKTSLELAVENSTDSIQVSLKSIEDAALIELEEIILDDLDAKMQVDTYENGQVKFEVGIKNGVKHGSYTEYSETGEVITKGSFKNDQPSGLWKFYDEEGNLIKRKRY